MSKTSEFIWRVIIIVAWTYFLLDTVLLQGARSLL